jgi:hypothetical protein
MKFENQTDYFNYVACFFKEKKSLIQLLYFLLLTWCLDQLIRNLTNLTDSKINNHVSF